MDEYALAFEQSLDDATEAADEYLGRDAIIAVFDAKLAELREARLDG